MAPANFSLLLLLSVQWGIENSWRNEELLQCILVCSLLSLFRHNNSLIYVSFVIIQVDTLWEISHIGLLLCRIAHSALLYSVGKHNILSPNSSCVVLDQ